MNRRTAIASAAVSTGILASLMVAGIAVVSATDTDETEATTQLVVATEVTVPSVSAPTLEPGEVPALVIPTAPGTATSADPATSTITRAQARAAVLGELPGDVVRIRAVRHEGYDAFAVRVRGRDGAVVDGFVDRASGVVYSWVTVSGPTVAAQYQDDDDDDDHGDGHDDADEHAEYDDDDD